MEWRHVSLSYESVQVTRRGARKSSILCVGQGAVDVIFHFHGEQVPHQCDVGPNVGSQRDASGITRVGLRILSSRPVVIGKMAVGFQSKGAGATVSLGVGVPASIEAHRFEPHRDGLVSGDVQRRRVSQGNVVVGSVEAQGSSNLSLRPGWTTDQGSVMPVATGISCSGSDTFVELVP